MKTFNDVTEMFNKSIKQDPITGEFICPVCGKKSKKENTIIKHMEKQDCANLASICKDTIHEENALKFVNEHSNKLSVNQFRQSLIYNSAIRFVLFCSDIETHPDNLYAYIFARSKGSPTFIQCISKIALTNINVTEYRRWLQLNHTIMIDSLEFYKANKENLNDETFLKTSIIKGKVSFMFIANKRPELLDNMSAGNFISLQEFLSGMG